MTSTLTVNLFFTMIASPFVYWFIACRVSKHRAAAGDRRYFDRTCWSWPQFFFKAYMKFGLGVIDWFTIGRQRCPKCLHSANHHAKHLSQYNRQPMTTCFMKTESLAENAEGYLYPVKASCLCTLDRTLIYYNQHKFTELTPADKARSLLSMSESELRGLPAIDGDSRQRATSGWRLAGRDFRG